MYYTNNWRLDVMKNIMDWKYEIEVKYILAQKGN